MGCKRAGTYSDELWVFSTTGMKWDLVSTDGGESPSRRAGHAMAIVGTDVFLFGGNALNHRGESGDSVRRKGCLYV